jgi:hypothetical protein
MQPMKFFIMCDLFVNVKFQDWALSPEQYGWPNGLTADEYYRLLKKQEKEQANNQGKTGISKVEEDAANSVAQQKEPPT